MVILRYRMNWPKSMRMGTLGQCKIIFLKIYISKHGLFLFCKNLQFSFENYIEFPATKGHCKKIQDFASPIDYNSFWPVLYK